MEEIEPETITATTPDGTVVSTNPFADTITLTMPSIEIKMVDATNLTDYEVWFFISSIVASFMSGFFAIYYQTKDMAIGSFTILLAIILIIAIVMTGYKRRMIAKKSKSYRLVSSGIEEMEE